MREIQRLFRNFLGKNPLNVLSSLAGFSLHCGSFCSHLYYYFRKKILHVSQSFEKRKNMLVRFFTIKRGRYNRPFLHIAAMLVLVIGILIAPLLADSYPVFSKNKDQTLLASAQQQSITVDNNVFKTQISQKPRDKVITYTVERGDTVSTIAKKFDISADTIRWANNLSNDNLSIGDELRILPVSGISHKVSKGDTVYSIAKTYDTEPQKVVDFPFNEFANPETFSLVEGQIVIVPDGIKPSEKPFIRRQVFIASGPVSVSSAGLTWPLRGEISQFASWYHMALDITSPLGTPVAAAQTGKVTSVVVGAWDGGYGTNVWVSNGAGTDTHYTHLSGINVNVGDDVVAGKTVVGWVGLTGRTTGAHLHFEVRRGGGLVNPMQYLQ